MKTGSPDQQGQEVLSVASFAVGSVNWLAFCLTEAFYTGATWGRGGLSKVECELVGAEMAKIEWRNFVPTAEDLLRGESVDTPETSVVGRRPDNHKTTGKP